MLQVVNSKSFGTKETSSTCTNKDAGVVELVDSGDLDSPATSVRVRVPSPAPYVGVAQLDSATAF